MDFLISMGLRAFGVLVFMALLWLFYLVVKEALSWQRLPLSRARTKGPGPRLADQDRALRTFVSAWKERGFEGGDRIAQAFPKLHIEWRAGFYVFDPSLLNEYGEPIPMRSLMPSRNHLVVASLEDDSLGETEFFDALTSLALWVTDKRGRRFQGKTPDHARLVEDLKSLSW